MFDYAGWVQRAKEFTAGMERFRNESEDLDIRVQVEPPLTPIQMKRMAAELEKEHSIRIPAVLCALLTTASRHCDCHYVWTPTGKKLHELDSILGSDYVFGGAAFCSASRMAGLAGFYKDEGAEYYPHYPLEMFHFLETSEGNSLALNLSHESDDPPVFYMCHDGGCGPIASSFTSFLTAWERLCYIESSHWFDDYFLDEYFNGKKCINGDSKKAKQLRILFEME